MRLLVLLLLLLCVGCKANVLKQSYLYKGDVFLPLSLPPPTDIRTGSGAPGPKYWQQQVDHDIQATLQIESNVIEGSDTITYHNNSPDTLRYIWLQLSQNIHLEDSIRAREGRNTGETDYAGMSLHHVLIDGNSVSLQEYGTLAKVTLATPLEPHNSLTMSLEWEFPMPVHANLRMGYDDSYADGAVWEVAQWFPNPCVYDDMYGWNTLPYIGRGEFYTNFGNYTVELTVPSNHLVFASGALVNPKEVLTDEQQNLLTQAMATNDVIVIKSSDENSIEADGNVVWKFEAENVRTFAWATSASFIWEASSVEIETLDGGTTRILCQSAYPKEEAKIWDEAVQYVQHAISYYSAMLYPYPWPQMTVVRGAAGGMEYPMLVYCRGRSHEGLFNVTDHEVGHSWFPMLLNTDERRHAWMDEGFNTYVNYYSLEAYYGAREHDPDVARYDATRFVHDVKAVNTPPDLLKSRGHLSYRKPGYGLRFLREEILGEARFDEAFKEYVRRWAFKSPRPADFYRTIEDAAGVDLQWFYRGFFEEPMQLDQGIFGANAVQKKDEWSIRVVLQNYSDWVCPVALRITCIDGTAHDFSLPVTIWAWSTQHIQTFKVPCKVHSVVIDPENVYPDVNLSNNKWFFN